MVTEVLAAYEDRHWTVLNALFCANPRPHPPAPTPALGQEKGREGEVRSVLVVTNMWPTVALPMSGIFVAEQVESLRQAGLDIDVLFIDGITGGWREYARAFGQVRRALRDKHYSLVHAHYVFSGIVALVGRLLAQERVPIVLTQHGIETQVGWTAPLCRWTSGQVDVTIATSRRVQAALNRSDSLVIPCGVNTTLFRPMDRQAARAELGWQAYERIVLFAGMRRPEKRLDLIEAAVAQVRLTRPDARLVIAENVPHADMPLYMNAADVLVLASEAEGSPMVVKEALACNLPVVSVDVGDVRELVEQASGCYIVKRTIAGLAAGIEQALAGRPAALNLRAAVEELSLTAVAEQLIVLYEAVYERVRVKYSSKLQTSARESD
jgi:glycosyltransferase involved in cell wall biosynthesis